MPVAGGATLTEPQPTGAADTARTAEAYAT